jgi:hypothetical protein
MRCRGEAAVSDPAVEATCALITFPPCALVQLRRRSPTRIAPSLAATDWDFWAAAKTHRFRQLGHIQCGGQVKGQ